MTLKTKTKTPFSETTLDEVDSCLKYTGETKSLDDMQDAIREAAIERSKQRGIIELFGCMPNDDDYDYKLHRSSKPAVMLYT